MKYFLFIALFLIALPVQAQFIDHFDGETMIKNPSAINGCALYFGDGVAKMNFNQKNGFATIQVDASAHQLGIWRALIKHRVSQNLDLEKLQKPEYELPDTTNWHTLSFTTRNFDAVLSDSAWTKENVTYNSLLAGKLRTKVINGQMIIDWEITPKKRGKSYFTTNKAVMQRLLGGKTKELIILPLGAVHASFLENNRATARNSILQLNKLF